MVETQGLVERLAECVYAPGNLLGAPLVVCIAAERGYDLGRCSQSMMLAAWNDGVTSCPNGVRDGDRAGELLGLREGEQLGIVLSFGYPASGRYGDSRSAERWSAGANRKPRDEIVERL